MLKDCNNAALGHELVPIITKGNSPAIVGPTIPIVMSQSLSSCDIMQGANAQQMIMGSLPLTTTSSSISGSMQSQHQGGGIILPEILSDTQSQQLGMVVINTPGMVQLTTPPHIMTGVYTLQEEPEEIDIEENTPM